MNLLTTEQLETLSGRLEPVDGFRVASMDVDFDPFDFARTGAGLVDRAVAYSMPDGHRLGGIGAAGRGAHSSAGWGGNHPWGDAGVFGCVGDERRFAPSAVRGIHLSVA